MPKYHVSKSIEIDAPPRRVFDVVVDYRTWTTWSPWLIAEPEAQVTISPDASSVGSTYAWKGKVTGEGELEHLRLEPGARVEDELRFIKPFRSICRTNFEMAPVGSGTRLTWSLDASLPWFLFWMVPMMRTLIGMDYRRGLLMLKEHIETGSIASKTSVAGVETVKPVRLAGIASQCEIEAIGPAMEASLADARAEFAREGLPTSGEPMSVYTKIRLGPGIFEFITGWTLPDGVDVPATSKLATWSMPEGEAFHVRHVGAYRHLGNGWSVANMVARYRKLKMSRRGAYEIYRSDPAATPEAEAVTDIYLPLR